MISIYWPYKTVPDWFESISFSGISNGTPTAKHMGFGVIISSKGELIVWHLFGYVISINGAGMDVKIKGGGNGVFMYCSLSSFIKKLTRGTDEPLKTK